MLCYNTYFSKHFVNKNLGTDEMKKTVLVYGHLDVQPADKMTDPFELVEKDGKLFGRGSTDDKGPVIAWIHAISVLKKKGVDIPVNLKFVFECMEESGSEGLEEALRKHKDDFLKNVDMTCISDNYWLGKKKPCLTYGLRGLCYYFVEVSCAKQDLHSGSYGGTLPEAMNDLVWILSQLTDLDGTIRVPHIYDLVEPLTDGERKIYEGIEFDHEEYKKDIAAHSLLKSTKEELLMSRWRYPSLSIHGIEGAFSQPGAKTVIPNKVIGKFSIRIVPNMTPKSVDKLVIAYLNDLWAKRGSPNHYNAVAHHGGMPWVTDIKHLNFRAGARAMKRVFGVEPDYTREGGTIPICITFQELTGNNVMLLPIGACDDMAHSQNEKLDRSNFIQGTKTLAAYLLELAE
uniref:M20_dimer domain-containing protein n=1 Tax=Angiostrongylus cantonensis TaxID=6313 RepID=A0A0K0D6D0_ANGCA